MSHFLGIQDVNGAPDVFGAIGGIFGIPQQGEQNNVQQAEQNSVPLGDPYSFTPGGGVSPNNSMEIKRALGSAGIPFDSPIAVQLFDEYRGLGDIVPVSIQQSLEGLVTDQRNKNEVARLAAVARDSKTTQLANIDEAGTRTQASIDRLGKVLGPGGLGSDAEFASMLTQAERPLAGIVRDTRGAAASGLASAGLRSAGKASSGVRRAEIGVQGERGRIRSGILGNVQDRKNQLQGFLDRDIFNARNQIESGSLGPIFAASAAKTGIGPLDKFGPSAGTAFDIQAGKKGFAQQDFGLLSSILLGGGSLLGNGTSDFLRFLGNPSGN